MMNFIRGSLLHNPALFRFSQQRNFGALLKQKFGTDTPAQSKRYHLGLFHGKTHAQRKKRVFSMKYRIETQKPNIYKKKLHSDILNRDFNLWISMKTRKCIMKCGSLDKYLLNTKPKHIDSKFGMYLREILQKHQKDPSTPHEYIAGTARMPRNRKTKQWEHRNMPTMYTPANIRAVTDFSEFYERPPHEMSRYEL